MYPTCVSSKLCEFFLCTFIFFTSTQKLFIKLHGHINAGVFICFIRFYLFHPCLFVFICFICLYLFLSVCLYLFQSVSDCHILTLTGFNAQKLKVDEMDGIGFLNASMLRAYHRLSTNLLVYKWSSCGLLVVLWCHIMYLAAWAPEGAKDTVNARVQRPQRP